MCSVMWAMPGCAPSKREPARIATAMAVSGPGARSCSTVSAPCCRRAGSRRRNVTATVLAPVAQRRREAVRASRAIHRGFQLVDQRGEDGEAALPEGRIVDVETEAREQRAGLLAAAGGEQLEIARDERVALLAVALVERQHEQLAEHVRVAVEAAVDEVRDVAPSPAVRRNHLHRVAVQACILGPP